MAIDQFHEQVNALVKGDIGAVGLTESPQALERWMVAGPEMARVLLELEASSSIPSDTTTGKHLEQSHCTQLMFANDVLSPLATFEDMGNPFFEDSGDMLSLDKTLFSRLYIACQVRQSNLDSLFEHENQACPPSISDMGQLPHGSRSDLMECLVLTTSKYYPGIETKVLDGDAIVHNGQCNVTGFYE